MFAVGVLSGYAIKNGHPTILAIFVSAIFVLAALLYNPNHD